MISTHPLSGVIFNTFFGLPFAMIGWMLFRFAPEGSRVVVAGVDQERLLGGALVVTAGGLWCGAAAIAWAWHAQSPRRGALALAIVGMVVLCLVEVALAAAFLARDHVPALAAICFVFFPLYCTWGAYRILGEVPRYRGGRVAAAGPGRWRRWPGAMAVYIPVALVVVVPALAFAVPYGPTGAATPEEAFEAYVDALAAEDHSRLLDLAGPGEHDRESVRQTVDELVAQLGGGQLVVSDVDIVETRFLPPTRATHTGTVNGGPFCAQVPLMQYHRDIPPRRMRGEGRWFVELRSYSQAMLDGVGCDP